MDQGTTQILTALITTIGAIITGLGGAWITKSISNNANSSDLKSNPKTKGGTMKHKIAEHKIISIIIATLLGAVIGYSGSIFLPSQSKDKESASANENKSLNQQYTTQAWEYYNSGKFELAITTADKCIDEFQGSANREESNLEKSNAPTPPLGTFSEKEKATTLSRGLLNDVATCFFIKARSLEKLGRIEEARTVYNLTLKYPYARCWDTNGWFWSPAVTAQDRLDSMK